MTNDIHKLALITGASSGIGAAFANQLAAEGWGLILVARREERLRQMAEAIGRQAPGLQHGRAVEALVADLATPAGIELIERRIAASPGLDLLINNAGFGAGGPFHTVHLPKQLDMIHVHVIATTRLTRAALPAMVARDSGAIINVASIAGFANVPTGAMYGATKAWMISFSKTLAEELRGTGVRVQALCPGFTYSEFHDTPEYKDFDRSVIPPIMWMTAGEVAAASLKALKRNRAVVVPGWINKIIVALQRCPLGATGARVFGRRRWRRRKGPDQP